MPQGHTVAVFQQRCALVVVDSILSNRSTLHLFTFVPPSDRFGPFPNPNTCCLCYLFTLTFTLVRTLIRPFGSSWLYILGNRSVWKLDRAREGTERSPRKERISLERHGKAYQESLGSSHCPHCCHLYVPQSSQTQKKVSLTNTQIQTNAQPPSKDSSGPKSSGTS